MKALIHSRLLRESLPALVFVLASATVVWQLGDRIPSALFTDSHAMNLWFQADSPRYFDNMVNRWSDHYRTKVHPLFSLLTFPPIRTLAAVFDLSLVEAVRWFTTLIASLWGLTLYALLRVVSGRPLDALLYATLTLFSSAALFWLAIPETFPLGSISLLIPTLAVAAAGFSGLRLRTGHLIALGAVSLSVTVTNWMAGILAALQARPWREALQISINAFFIVTLLWGVEKAVFPTAKYFLDIGEEKDYILMSEAGGPQDKLRALLFHAVIMPTPEVKQEPSETAWALISVQKVSLGDTTLEGKAALFLWALLLLAALWALWYHRHSAFPQFITLLLAAQLGLHLVYGDESFLYSLHVVPLLISAIAVLSRTQWRGMTLVGVALLIPLLASNNLKQFEAATVFAQTQIPQRDQVLHQMRLRPHAPWPRGREHVVLALPGSRLPFKAYHEAGGPSARRWAVSAWPSG